MCILLAMLLLILQLQLLLRLRILRWGFQWMFRGCGTKQNTLCVCSLSKRRIIHILAILIPPRGDWPLKMTWKVTKNYFKSLVDSFSSLHRYLLQGSCNACNLKKQKKLLVTSKVFNLLQKICIENNYYNLKEKSNLKKKIWLLLSYLIESNFYQVQNPLEQKYVIFSLNLEICYRNGLCSSKINWNI